MIRLLLALSLFSTTAIAGDWYIPITAQHLGNKMPLNEANYGIGYGQRIDGADWYAMGFKDSHGKPSYMAGASKQWEAGNDNAAAFVGVSAFVMTRSNYRHYQPFPGALPFVGMRYRKTSLVASYIPAVGTSKTQAVFFFIKLSE